MARLELERAMYQFQGECRSQVTDSRNMRSQMLARRSEAVTLADENNDLPWIDEDFKVRLMITDTDLWWW